MRTFLLDLASNAGLIACVDQTSVIASRSIDRKASDGDLARMAQELIDEAKWTWKDCNRIACVTGPGGFMSLRVAAAFTNALAWANAIPSAGIHLSDLSYARILKPIIWIHSTKKLELFARGFGSFASQWPEPTHLHSKNFWLRSRKTRRS